MNKCKICPRNCNIDRINNLGFCQANNVMRIARANLHFGEEPCISGTKGSGTIFFSHCNLKCIYCQNYDISTLNNGYNITIEEFSNICLDLQNKGALNINLVTPSHYTHLIIKGIQLAKANGLIIPIIYNTNSYENIETIKSLNGLIDVYLPDFKYFNDKYAINYSNAHNYFNVANEAIKEMFNQVGKCKFNNGIIERGVIVRHLLLPGLEDDSKNILFHLYSIYKNNIFISIMNQYTPIKKHKYENLNRKITSSEYNKIIDYAWNIGIRNAFTQEEGTQDISFIPKFYKEKE